MSAERKNSRHLVSENDSITAGPDHSLVTTHAASGRRAASAISTHVKAFGRTAGMLTGEAILTGGWPFEEVTPLSGSLID
jgi:hypothetical protein